MKTEPEKKTPVALTNLVQSTVDIGKRAVDTAKVGVTAMVEKSKADEYTRRMKKYNPLFPDQYHSSSFNLPNIIVIVDDAVRRNVDVCQGAIGWLGNNTGTEVLYLYDEFAPVSGIQFVPAITCDSAYYLDSFDRNRFIRTDCIFRQAHEEKIAELKHIAYSLGAKRCTIDFSEATTSSKTKEKSANANAAFDGIQGKTSAESEQTSKNSKRRHGSDVIEFSGLRFPKRPTLKWFAHDDNILRLIEMCCNGKRGVKSETLEISGTSSATMTETVACAIDGAISKSRHIKGSISMKSQAKEEHRTKLIFHIEF